LSRHLAERGKLAGDEMVEHLLIAGKRVLAGLVHQREVDVARTPLALVELGHEGDRMALLRGDLLGARLV
jgi:hypothetical protein